MLIDYLKKEGYQNIKEIPGKGICGLRDFIFTTGLMIGMDELGYFGRYCYWSKEEALSAINSWDGQGDPPGDWVKYKGNGGERSNPNLDGCNSCKKAKYE